MVFIQKNTGDYRIIGVKSQIYQRGRSAWYFSLVGWF